VAIRITTAADGMDAAELLDTDLFVD